MPSCEAAAKKPCPVLLFSNVPFGLPQLQTSELAICPKGAGGGGEVVKEELFQLVGCRLETVSAEAGCYHTSKRLHLMLYGQVF